MDPYWQKYVNKRGRRKGPCSKMSTNTCRSDKSLKVTTWQSLHSNLGTSHQGQGKEYSITCAEPGSTETADEPTSRDILQNERPCLFQVEKDKEREIKTHPDEGRLKRHSHWNGPGVFGLGPKSSSVQKTRRTMGETGIRSVGRMTAFYPRRPPYFDTFTFILRNTHWRVARLRENTSKTNAPFLRLIFALDYMHTISWHLATYDKQLTIYTV